MALSTYAELQAAIGAWSFNRTDLPAADLIRLGEARLNRDLRLRVMEAESSLDLAAGERTAPLPSGFAAPLALWRLSQDGGRTPVRRAPAAMAVAGAAGRPQAWAVAGETIVFDRPCAEAESFVLRWLKGVALGDAEPENWLLARHPDAYLAAALVEAALWAADDEQAARWQARYQAAIDTINHREARSREAPLATDLPDGVGATSSGDD